MTAEAKARFREGLEFYKAHKNMEARAKYLQALALSQSAGIYLNLAIVEYDLLMYPDALRHAKAYVLHPKAEPGKVEKLKKEMIPELEAKTAHLSVEGQAGQAVFVDGEKIGVAPINDQVHVAPGEHTVACGTITKTVVVKAGDTAQVIVVVREVSPPPSASASVAPPPSASAAPRPVPSASASAKPPEVPVGPPKEGGGGGKWIGPAAFGAVGVGGLVVGIVFAGNANGAHDDQLAISKAAGGHACTVHGSATCTAYLSKGSDADSAATVSVVAYGVGGLGLAGALVWTCYNLMSGGKGDDKGTPSRAQVKPWFGATGGGTNVELSF
jgi:hypothetical protein